MDSNYYRLYFDLERNHWWFKARMDLLSQYIKKFIYRGQPLKVLNVGAATGATSMMLNQFGDVESIEYNLDCIAFTRGKINLQINHGDINSLEFQDNHFDLICVFDVIEHVEDHNQAIRELTRVCKKQGHILITVPALMSLWSEHDVINHHFRRYNLNEMNALLSNDLDINYTSYFNFYLFPFTYFYRKLSNLFNSIIPQKKSKSDFEKVKLGMISKILYKIFKSERVYLNGQIKLPFGVSIFAHAQKKADTLK